MATGTDNSKAKAIARQGEMLERFVEVYCRQKHGPAVAVRAVAVRATSAVGVPPASSVSCVPQQPQKRQDAGKMPTALAARTGTARAIRRGELCVECADLLAYARERLARCPMDPKPKCKDCSVHCYSGEYRRRIREVMRFSGLHFVKRGRLDWLVRYFLGR